MEVRKEVTPACRFVVQPRLELHRLLLILVQRLTRGVEQAAEGAVEPDPDFHVIVLTLGLDICNKDTHCKKNCTIVPKIS